MCFLSVGTVSLSRKWHNNNILDFCLLFEVTRFAWWHWAIRKHLALSFIWAHYHVHLADDRSTSRLLYSLLVHCAKQLVQGCNSWFSVLTSIEQHWLGLTAGKNFKLKNIRYRPRGNDPRIRNIVTENKSLGELIFSDLGASDYHRFIYWSADVRKS